MPHQSKTISIAALIKSFRDALYSLAPIYASVGLPWIEPDAYDDWDNVASRLYHSFIIRSFGELATPIKNALPIIPYDIRTANYNTSSFVSDAAASPAPFVCFESDKEAFDTCLFVKIDAEGNVTEEYRKLYSTVEWCIYIRSIDSGLVRHEKTLLDFWTR